MPVRITSNSRPGGAISPSTALVTPIISGVPAVEGQLGYDAVQFALSSFSNGQLGNLQRVISAGVAGDLATSSVSNTGLGDFPFSSLYTFPANTIFNRKAYRVRINAKITTGISLVTALIFCQLGGTKILTWGATDPGNNNVNKSQTYHFEIMGRSAVGAAADVECSSDQTFTGGGLSSVNNINQPVGGIATNGALALVFGVTFSGGGATETVEILSWTIEELN